MARTSLIHRAILIAFLMNTFGPMPMAQAQELSLPKPGVMVHLSLEFNPSILKGIKVHPDNPLRFEFVMDRGNSLPHRGEGKGGGNELKQESTKLIKYFLASITTPEKDLWVNLSPYEKDRIVPESFGQTEMGRDLLAEDYMLKQITASLLYPEDEVGKKFWKRIYEEAAKKYGTTNIPVNTFNKVWIVPQKAVVYENAKAQTAYVVEARLKVMLEEDYLSMEKHDKKMSSPNVLVGDLEVANPGPPTKTFGGDKNGINKLGSQIVREIIIPELTREVNEGKNFAQLRQVYNSLILATWYKKKIKDSILSQVYADKNKVAGVGYDKSLSSLPVRQAGPNVLIGDPDTNHPLGSRQKHSGTTNDVESIYQRYLQAFKKGTYNYIKEEIDPSTQQLMPRKYFSGGIAWGGKNLDLAMTTIHVLPDRAMLKDTNLLITADLSSEDTEDQAMNGSLTKETLSGLFDGFYKEFGGQRVGMAGPKEVWRALSQVDLRQGQHLIDLDFYDGLVVLIAALRGSTARKLCSDTDFYRVKSMVEKFLEYISEHNKDGYPALVSEKTDNGYLWRRADHEQGSIELLMSNPLDHRVDFSEEDVVYRSQLVEDGTAKSLLRKLYHQLKVGAFYVEQKITSRHGHLTLPFILDLPRTHHVSDGTVYRMGFERLNVVDQDQQIKNSLSHQVFSKAGEGVQYKFYTAPGYPYGLKIEKTEEQMKTEHQAAMEKALMAQPSVWEFLQRHISLLRIKPIRNAGERATLMWKAYKQQEGLKDRLQDHMQRYYSKRAEGLRIRMEKLKHSQAVFPVFPLSALEYKVQMQDGKVENRQAATGLVFPVGEALKDVFKGIDPDDYEGEEQIKLILLEVIRKIKEELWAYGVFDKAFSISINWGMKPGAESKDDVRLFDFGELTTNKQEALKALFNLKEYTHWVIKGTNPNSIESLTNERIADWFEKVVKEELTTRKLEELWNTKKDQAQLVTKIKRQLDSLVAETLRKIYGDGFQFTKEGQAPQWRHAWYLRNSHCLQWHEKEGFYQFQGPDGGIFNIKFGYSVDIAKERFLYEMANVVGVNVPGTKILEPELTLEAYENVPAPDSWLPESALVWQDLDSMTVEDLNNRESTGLEEAAVFIQLLHVALNASESISLRMIADKPDMKTYILSNFKYFDFDTQYDARDYVRIWIDNILDINPERFLYALKRLTVNKQYFNDVLSKHWDLLGGEDAVRQLDRLHGKVASGLLKGLSDLRNQYLKDNIKKEALDHLVVVLEEAIYSHQLDADRAMKGADLNKTSGSGPGGIDLTSDKALQIQNKEGAIQFYMDPAMLAKLKNTTGFVPVIINIQPMTDLRIFLESA
ncbi:MAG: hypothetical protein HQL15_06795 [Candidatus Omnitrophica bacterium]|nr:hypothetical protein [Candidatus Omnitrophota bacterium]